MKNLINENLISSEILYDFNSIIKKLNLTNSEFSYEPFTFGFTLNPGDTYLVIDYESSGNYLIKILDNKNSALVIKGYKYGKNISNSKLIAPNPFVSVGDNNSIKYFKLINSNNKNNNPISESEYLHINKNTPQENNFYCTSTVTLNHRYNHNENIIKIMDKLLEMHFKNNNIDNKPMNSSNPKNQFNNSITQQKFINLNEIIPKKPSGNINLNEVNPIGNENSTKDKNPINYQELIKMQKWKDELYSILF